MSKDTAVTEEKRAQFIRFIKEQTQKDASSRETARAVLIEEGTYTAKGDLAPEFGGGKNGGSPIVEPD